MLKKLTAIVAAPFKWGFEAVDTHPSGGAYRQVASHLTGVLQGANGDQGEINLVVGKGKVDRLAVIETIKASTPEEAVNATLKFMGTLRRSKVNTIRRKIREVEQVVAAEAKAAKLMAKAKETAGKVPMGSTEKTIPSTPEIVVSGPAVGEPVLV